MTNLKIAGISCHQKFAPCDPPFVVSNIQLVQDVPKKAFPGS